MKRFMKSKKGIALLVTLVVVGASAFGAYAYFTSTGSGSGTATVGSAANDLTLTATISSTLYPGHTYNLDNIRIANPETFAQAASSVSPDLVNGDAVTGVSVSGGTNLHGGCSASWFHFYGDGTNADSTLSLSGAPVSIPASGHVDFAYASTGAKVGMDETGGNQSDCEGATITFHLTSA
jgi:hypothetical protein